MARRESGPKAVFLYQVGLHRIKTALLDLIRGEFLFPAALRFSGCRAEFAGKLLVSMEELYWIQKTAVCTP